jgi:hypothetical protein
LDSEALEERLLSIVERQETGHSRELESSSSRRKGSSKRGEARGYGSAKEDVYVQQALLFAGVDVGDGGEEGTRGGSSGSDEYEFDDDEDIMALLKQKL